METLLLPAPLVPSLPDVACKRTRHAITDLKDGDLLHVRADILGPDGHPLFRKGTILPVLGFCRCDDLQGRPYVVRAYVPGFGTTWPARDARRFPTALQQEVVFSFPLRLSDDRVAILISSSTPQSLEIESDGTAEHQRYQSRNRAFHGFAAFSQLILDRASKRWLNARARRDCCGRSTSARFARLWGAASSKSRTS